MQNATTLLNAVILRQNAAIRSLARNYEFLYALILGGGDVKTLPVVIPALINQRGVEWGIIAAIGSVVILPILILVFVVQKHIVRGLTMGAVKG